MRLIIRHTPQTENEVEAEQTGNPELAIFQMDVRERIGERDQMEEQISRSIPRLGPPVGQAWGLAHIASGKLLIHGLLTRDLALAVAQMFGNVDPAINSQKNFEVHFLQTCVSVITDLYFAAVKGTAKDKIAFD